MNASIEKSWKKVLQNELDSPYFAELTRIVNAAYLGVTPVYPAPKFLFNAFSLCPFDDVRVVILGQDPYHGAGQAHGLCFSVQDGVRVPPSLQNIYKEIEDDMGTTSLKPMHADAVQGVSEAHDQAVEIYSAKVNERDNDEMRRVHRFESGNLERWAQQGILLLNATLTVEAGSPASHQGIGWERFTDAVIQKISDEKEHVVFLLWGKYAQDKGGHIDTSKHLVLKAPHPSPFSAYTGFLGCKHFSKTNEYLSKHGRAPIDW